MRVLIFDTGTGATQNKPWGEDSLTVYRHLRAMLEAYAELCIVILLHLRKPNSRSGGRSLTDVLGDWGKWNDVTLLMEADGPARTKLTLRKRVRRERRIVATQRGGLLVDAQELVEVGQTKVPLEVVMAAIAASPGISAEALGLRLGVSKDTAARYATKAWAKGEVWHDAEGPRGAFRYFPKVDATEEQLLAELKEDR